MEKMELRHLKKGGKGGGAAGRLENLLDSSGGKLETVNILLGNGGEESWECGKGCISNNEAK